MTQFKSSMEDAAASVAAAYNSDDDDSDEDYGFLYAGTSTGRLIDSRPTDAAAAGSTAATTKTPLRRCDSDDDSVEAKPHSMPNLGRFGTTHRSRQHRSSLLWEDLGDWGGGGIPGVDDYNNDGTEVWPSLTRPLNHGSSSNSSSDNNVVDHPSRRRRPSAPRRSSPVPVAPTTSAADSPTLRSGSPTRQNSTSSTTNSVTATATAKSSTAAGTPPPERQQLRRRKLKGSKSQSNISGTMGKGLFPSPKKALFRSSSTASADRDDHTNHTRSTIGTTTTSSSSTTKVAFVGIEIFEHAYELGDNPSVSCGAPLTISWDQQSCLRLSVDEYEYHRPPRRKAKQGLRLSVSDRAKVLLKSGYSMEEIVLCALQVVHDKQLRALSVKQKKWDPWHYGIELTTRRLKKIILPSSNTTTTNNNNGTNTNNNGGRIRPRRASFLSLHNPSSTIASQQKHHQEVSSSSSSSITTTATTPSSTGSSPPPPSSLRRRRRHSFLENLVGGGGSGNSNSSSTGTRGGGAEAATAAAAAIVAAEDDDDDVVNDDDRQLDDNNKNMTEYGGQSLKGKPDTSTSNIKKHTNNDTPPGSKLGIRQLSVPARSA